MNDVKQYILATSLLTTALFCSLLISYWLNQDNTESITSNSVSVDSQLERPKVNKMKKSMRVLLPTIRLK